MYNWSTDEKNFKRKFPQEYQRWRMLQLINYGLDGEKLERKQLKKLWPEIKSEIKDPLIKKCLESLAGLHE